jgi:hypothetical protein
MSELKINWSDEYKNIKEEEIKNFANDIVKILEKNPGWEELRGTQMWKNIASEINTELGKKYEQGILKAKGHNEFTDSFKSELIREYEKLPIKEKGQEEFLYFLMVVIPKVKNKCQNRYNELSHKEKELKFKDPDFLQNSTNKEVLQHLIKIEIRERIISAREFDFEIGLIDEEKKDYVNEVRVNNGLHNLFKDSAPYTWIDIFDFLASDVATDIGPILMGTPSNPSLKNIATAKMHLNHVFWFLKKEGYFKVEFYKTKDVAEFISSNIEGYQVSARKLNSKDSPPSLDPEFKMIVNNKFKK